MSQAKDLEDEPIRMQGKHRQEAPREPSRKIRKAITGFLSPTRKVRLPQRPSFATCAASALTSVPPVSSLLVKRSDISCGEQVRLELREAADSKVYVSQRDFPQSFFASYLQSIHTRYLHFQHSFLVVDKTCRAKFSNFRLRACRAVVRVMSGYELPINVSTTRSGPHFP